MSLLCLAGHMSSSGQSLGWTQVVCPWSLATPPLDFKTLTPIVSLRGSLWVPISQIGPSRQGEVRSVA